MANNKNLVPVHQGKQNNMSPYGSQSSPSWQMIRRMQEDMDSVFNQLFGISPSSSSSSGALSGAQNMQIWSPSMDVSEDNKEVCLEVDMPGVQENDIDIQVQDHTLILSAQMNQQNEQDQKNRQYYRRERRSGSFQEILPLPQNIDENDIRADFNNGVLKIHLPKSQQAQQGRRIQVEGQSGQQKPQQNSQTGQTSNAQMAGSGQSPTQASGSAATQGTGTETKKEIASSGKSSWVPPPHWETEAISRPPAPLFPESAQADFVLLLLRF